MKHVDESTFEHEPKANGDSDREANAATVSCTFGVGVSRLGMVLQPLSIDEDEKRGCYIEKVHSGMPAAEKGLRPGMTLEHLNGEDGMSSASFNSILSRLKQRPMFSRWAQTFSSRSLPSR